MDNTTILNNLRDEHLVIYEQLNVFSDLLNVLHDNITIIQDNIDLLMDKFATDGYVQDIIDLLNSQI